MLSHRNARWLWQGFNGVARSGAGLDDGNADHMFEKMPNLEFAEANDLSGNQGASHLIPHSGGQVDDIVRV
jgi:hypothetical protein